MKLRVYIETTIPSYLTAWPSENALRAAHQQVTHDWWSGRNLYDLFTSELVLEECRKGDPDAASERILAMAEIPSLDQAQVIDELAIEIARRVPLPPNASTDALHIATAASHRINCLLTWNCAHIANVSMWLMIRGVCRSADWEHPYTPPCSSSRSF